MCREAPNDRENVDAERCYLDYNATAPVKPDVAQVVVRALLLPGNPSSVHAEGRAARAVVEDAREAVATLVGAYARNVVFTGSGTEAAAMALTPEFGLRRGDQRPALLYVGAGEHACVLEGHRFPDDAMQRIPLGEDGRADLDWLSMALAAAEGTRPVVSLQLANNETGVIQPVAEAVALVRRHDGAIHTDAVQAAGRIPLDMAVLGVDALTLSAHKLAGPKGVGALVLAEGVSVGTPLVRGGGQESGRRAGTHDVAGIAGFGEAARLASIGMDDEARRLARLRDALEARLQALDNRIVVVGADAPRLPNTSLVLLPGRKAETALMAFDLRGIAVSSGAACSSGKVGRSHVLDAMGLAPHLAEGAVRISFGWKSCEADVIRFASAYEEMLRSVTMKRDAA